MADTEPTYDVQGNYGQGWEVVTAGTKKEALANLQEYRENEPGIPFRIRRATTTDKEEG